MPRSNFLRFVLFPCIAPASRRLCSLMLVLLVSDQEIQCVHIDVETSTEPHNRQSLKVFSSHSAVCTLQLGQTYRRIGSLENNGKAARQDLRLFSFPSSNRLCSSSYFTARRRLSQLKSCAASTSLPRPSANTAKLLIAAKFTRTREPICSFWALQPPAACLLSRFSVPRYTNNCPAQLWERLSMAVCHIPSRSGQCYPFCFLGRPNKKLVFVYPSILLQPTPPPLPPSTPSVFYSCLLSQLRNPWWRSLLSLVLKVYRQDVSLPSSVSFLPPYFLSLSFPILSTSVYFLGNHFQIF